MPPLCKGRWLAWQDGGVVKVIFSTKQSLTRLRRELPLHKGAFLFAYDLSIFLTSTAFVDTNSKYGTPLSRYAVFLKTVL